MSYKPGILYTPLLSVFIAHGLTLAVSRLLVWHHSPKDCIVLSRESCIYSPIHIASGNSTTSHQGCFIRLVFFLLTQHPDSIVSPITVVLVVSRNACGNNTVNLVVVTALLCNTRSYNDEREPFRQRAGHVRRAGLRPQRSAPGQSSILWLAGFFGE